MKRAKAVSIHAPVKGRPCSWSAAPKPKPGFDPRPREGATAGNGRTGDALGGFDPRPREGATLELVNLRRIAGVSIHAPVKGRPVTASEYYPDTDRFDPRPREGATVAR